MNINVHRCLDSITFLAPVHGTYKSPWGRRSPHRLQVPEGKGRIEWGSWNNVCRLVGQCSRSLSNVKIPTGTTASQPTPSNLGRWRDVPVGAMGVFAEGLVGGERCGRWLYRRPAGRARRWHGPGRDWVGVGLVWSGSEGEGGGLPTLLLHAGSGCVLNSIDGGPERVF